VELAEGKTYINDGLDGTTRISFLSPARESAYDFIISCRSSRTYYRRRWWEKKPDNHNEFYQVVNLTRRTAWLNTRNYTIFEPAAAETAINSLLSDALASAESEQLINQGWAVRAELAIPTAVRNLIRNELKEKFAIEAKARAAAALIEVTGKLRIGWDQFLDSAAGSPNAHHAVKLAEDPRNLAQVLEAVMKDRKKDANDLLLLINKIIEAQQSADILDLVVKSESVLRETLKMMGIPVPDPEGTLLAPLEGDI
jgi:hypothetical protein